MLRAAGEQGTRRAPAGLLDAVARQVAEAGPSVVAFSAGVDSTVVLAVAQQVLGDGALAVTGLSPSVAPAEADDAARIAQALGATLLFQPTTEMDNPDYVANGADRCFHCKTDLYAVCRAVARERGLTFFELFPDRQNALLSVHANDVSDEKITLLGGVVELVHNYAHEEGILPGLGPALPSQRISPGGPQKESCHQPR